MKTLVLAFLCLLTGICTAQDADIIERSLTADASREQRLADGTEVVSQLARLGIFAEDPNERREYSSFYIPKKPISVLGARLVSFEHEYADEYLGCCVNPGNAVILQPAGATADIEAFAQRNGCRYAVGDEIFVLPKSVTQGLSDSERAALVEVSCKDDYLFEAKKE
ncbi:MAG: hypothetical protein U1F26_05980 [Lysobacterales bacterium]